jgi:hypothetical protein
VGADPAGAAAAAQAASQPASAKLSAVDGATWAANKLLYLSGPTAVGVTDLLAYWRTALGLALGSPLQVLRVNAGGAALEYAAPGAGAAGNLRFVIDGGGSVITTGAKKAYLIVPYNCTITSWTILTDQSGTIGFDVWKDSYTNFPPTDSDSFVDVIGGTSPTLSPAGVKATSSSLGAWSATSLTAGQVLEISVLAATVVTKATLDLAVTRT